MGKWFSQFQALIFAASLVASSLLWVYSTFASKEYVEQKHDGVMDVLRDIKTSVEKIDERTYDLARERSQKEK
jgi:hypothetical protein